MRQITQNIQLILDGSPQGFRLTKPDAFSGVEILRLLLRLQDEPPATAGGPASPPADAATSRPSARTSTNSFSSR